MFVGAWVVLATWTCFSTCTDVRVDRDGGYSDVAVGVSAEMGQSEIERLLPRLKALFKDASRALSVATHGKSYFREIIFALPKSFRGSFEAEDIVYDKKYFANPDVQVVGRGLFDKPYTTQHGGCGSPGLRVVLPVGFVVSTAKSKEKALIREWAKYRYGVFSESGFEGDELYPSCYNIPGSDEFRVTDCTNEKAAYLFKENNKLTAKPSNTTCKPVPVSDQNEGIRSSLLSNTAFPKVMHFCDDENHPHNRDAPTKQNSLCREQSVWEVISSHEDFNFERSGIAADVTLSFKYAIEADPRFILTVDSSKNMLENARMDLLRNAFSYFVMYNLPIGTKAAVLDFKVKESNDNNPSPFLEMRSNADIDRIIDSFPDAAADNEICGHCAIYTAIEILQENSHRASGTLVVATATDISDDSIGDIVEHLKSLDVTVHVIYFDDTIKIAPEIEKLALVTGGKFFYIPEFFRNGSHISTLTTLYEAFKTVYRSFSWTSRDHVLLDQKTFADGATNYSMSFVSDKSVRKLQVVLTGPNFLFGPPVYKDEAVLSYGNRKYTRIHASFSYKIKIPAFVFTVDNAQAGLWSFAFKRKPGYDDPLVVIIRASNEFNKILSMDSLLSFHDNPMQPKVLYSELKRGSLPVANADVKVSVYQQNFDYETTIELKDGGEGDPDITKNDGIYSRYYTDTPITGYYLLTFTSEKFYAENETKISGSSESECCGNAVPLNLVYDSGPFKRITTYSGFYVRGTEHREDFPPRRIVDFRVSGADTMRNNITLYTLEWTAPGERYDRGKVAAYELKMFLSRKDALSHFDNSGVLTLDKWNYDGPALRPDPAGTAQSLTFHLNDMKSRVYFLAMRSVTRAGQKSEPSNVVQILYSNPNTHGTSVSPDATMYPWNTTATPGVNREGSSEVDLAIGISCGILFLMLIAGFMCFVYISRHKNKKQGAFPPKTESNDTLCHSTNLSVITPVHSWTAGSLVSQYETVQQSRNNSTCTIKHDDTSDGISLTSSSYSYKPTRTSSIYDPVYFNTSRDDINYPVNPAYSSFNPMYTSSLSRLRNTNDPYNHYPVEDGRYATVSTGIHRSRLRTDV